MSQTPPPPPPPEPWLACEGCGYNLTGICTPDTPEGDCPECGHRFNRRRLEMIGWQEPFPGHALLAMTFLYPTVLLFTGAVCGCMGGILSDAANAGLWAIPSALLCMALVAAVSNHATAAHIARFVDGRRTGRPPAAHRPRRDPVYWWVLAGMILSQMVIAVAYLFGLAALVGAIWW